MTAGEDNKQQDVLFMTRGNDVGVTTTSLFTPVRREMSPAMMSNDENVGL